MEHILGFDIGGTKTEITLFQVGSGSGEFQVSRQGKKSDIKTVASKRMPTDRDEGYDHYVNNLVELINTVSNEANIQISDIDGFGLGLPGSVHPETGKMLKGNTRMLEGKDIIGDLRSATGFSNSISVNNDASCFALAEALCGAGLKYEEDHGIPVERQQSIGIILGTGCGGGLILNGKILNGGKGGGGEIGHSTLITNGRDCYCGRKGCAEQYLSGPGLEKTASMKSAEVFEKAESGDDQAKAIVEEYRFQLSEFLTNLNNVYDPHFFVLGGGVSKQSLIYTGIEDLLGEKMFVQGKVPNVYQHQLSDSAGVLGAAIMVL